MKKSKPGRGSSDPLHRQDAEDQDECPLCYQGTVFIGYLVEGESGDEVEVIVGEPCKRYRPKQED